MALDIVTGTHNSAETRFAETAQDVAEDRERPRRTAGLSPLTKRILGVNVIALAILGIVLLQLGDYQKSLIDAQVAALKTQAQVFAAALGEGAVSEDAGGNEVLAPELARQMTRRLIEPTKRRARVFDTEGRLLVDTRALESFGGVQVSELPPPDNGGLIERTANQIYQFFIRILPGRYPNEENLPIESPGNYPEVRLANYGDIADAVRRRADGGLVLSVAVPIQHYRKVLGALLLSSDNGQVEQQVRGVRFTILEAFTVAFIVTVLLSLYLAGTIARPLRRLADAAERIRQGHGRQVPIPAFDRHDEIGDLARALREMTGTLWQRMDATERFAADVAHEIKNPLSSVRSAIETAVRIPDPEKRQKLLLLVLDDIERLTRLINDISDASRLDAELSRSSMETVYVGRVLEAVVEVNQATAGDRTVPSIELTRSGPRNSAAGDLAVIGHEDRLVQVFRNVIANALSFSPPDGTIRITATRQSGYVVVTIDDDGPGIPEGKLAAIFERFYSERPEGEKFGTHSGLGLSISRQIVESHHGSVRAENRTDRAGKVLGARFIVRLPAA
ncbi:MAG TPA: stimulus-sensing domain-containing protein [Stellaceae bacterium]|jgi:two-component system sensor histidine kinase ChvG|nr:stimulus-sensing domain-containing protein [Stellaceae bacterium]